MKPITRIFVLILSLCMLVSVASINSFAAAEDIMMTVSDTEAELGDKIEVTISNKEVTFRGLTLKLSFDTSIVKCVEMYNVDGDDGDFEELYMYYFRPNGKLKDMYPDVCDTIELTNSDGKFQYGMVPGDDTKFEDGDIVKLVFEVIGEGQFTFDLEKVIVDADGEFKVNHTFDVTIKSATPACEHSDTKLVSNNDGTHNVVCANADCSTVVTANVKCSGTDDGDHTTDVKCDCGYVVTAGTNHTFLNNNRGTKLTEGNCLTAATYAAKCDYCDYEDKTEVITGERDMSNHVGTQTTSCKDNGDGNHTKTVTCECGDEVSSTTEAHTYDHQTRDFECDCGAKYTGWSSTVDGEGTTWTCYVLNGEVLSGWNNVDDSWYYFSIINGRPATGVTRVPYPSVAINGISYEPNAEDKEYAEKNADSKYTDAETAVFVFGADGKFVQTTGIIDGNRYAVNGMVEWHVGLVEVDGEYYYFGGDVNGGGNVMKTGKVYATRDYNSGKTVGDSCIYYFDAFGVLCEYDGITELDGKLHYFEGSRLMIGAGLTKVGDDYIYVRSHGQLAIGEYWVSNTNKICDPGMYTFGDDGFLVVVMDPETSEPANGIVDGVYYKNGKAYYAGLIEIDGDVYYVKSNGQLATGTYYITKTNDMPGFEKGDKLVFDAEGKLVTE